ncbi:translation initiation factor IF3-2, chloroplastic-like [Bidens hawaiensis]|uniref:translation initiation factor IF3-2, chloroplastic-like n=1 Tax=Bidens hawaiensis TaxID=980011 RepID=UPI00404A9EBD
MAGITTTSSCSIHPFKQPITLSHLQSKPYLHFPTSFTFNTCRITCRYGGGGNYSRQGDNRRPKQNSDDDPALDISRIKSNNVRLIDEEQNMVGVVSKSAAIQMAEDAELDLFIVSPDADPPVVRLMDYKKYKYEQQKKKKDQLKKNAAQRMDQKELKMGYNIDVHDYTVRLKAAQRFLKDGDKVKLIVSLKGRENEFKNNAIELMQRFRGDVGELAVEESKNYKDRNMTMVLVPNKAAIQKEAPKKKEKSTGTGTGTETQVSASV